jgi:hypothetical protein
MVIKDRIKRDTSRSLLLKVSGSEFKYLSMCKAVSGSGDWYSFFMGLCKGKFGDFELPSSVVGLDSIRPSVSGSDLGDNDSDDVDQVVDTIFNKRV